MTELNPVRFTAMKIIDKFKVSVLEFVHVLTVGVVKAG